jgi:CheY-like chemotaxis protein
MENRLDILIVEDSVNDAHMIARILRRERADLKVRLLADGQEALDYLLDERSALPRVVLLDLKLPRRNGLEVLGLLRQQAHLNSIPIVMFSSSTQERDLRTAYRLGVNSYLVKPQAYQDLQTMIRQFSAYWLTQNKLPKHD